MGFFRWIEKTATSALRTFAEIRRASRPSTGELGISGTDICGTFISDEYLSDLADLETRCEIFDKMRKSEPVIHVSLRAHEKPIESARWSVVVDNVDSEGKDVNPDEAEKIRKFVHANLFENSTRPWVKLLRNILSYQQYGFSCCEKVWEIRDGLVWLADLAPRVQKTIRWNFEQGTAKLKSISQQTTTKYIKEIPAEKLIFFVNDQLGDNIEGIGLCRYQYRSWTMKALMMKLLAVGFERFLVKTPTVRPTADNVTANEVDKAKAFVQSIRSGAKTGGILPAGWEEITQSENFAGAMVALKFIEKLDQEMAMAGLTQFILLGMNGTGSYALSGDQTDFFMMALKGVIQDISDVFNYSVIPEIVDYNFSTPIYPRLEAKVTEENYQAWIDNLVKLVGANILPTNEQVRDIVAQRMELPEIDWEKAEEKKQAEMDGKEPPDSDDTPPDDTSGGKPEAKTKSEIKPKPACLCGEEGHDGHNRATSSPFWRELTPLEEKVGGIEYFAEKKSFLDLMTAEMEKKITPLLGKLADGVFKAKDTSKYNPPASLVNQIAGVVAEFLEAVSLDGLEGVGKEMKLDVPDVIRESLKVWAEEKAGIVADGQVQAVKNYVAGVMADLKLTGGDRAQISPDDKKKVMSEILRRAMGRIREALSVDDEAEEGENQEV